MEPKPPTMARGAISAGVLLPVHRGEGGKAAGSRRRAACRNRRSY